jgi:hypothetical protein
MASYDSPTPRQFHNPSGERAFRARARAARQKRAVASSLVSLIALAIILSLLAHRSAPSAPQFVVSWPASYGFGSSGITSGEIVLLRRGAPLLVSVQDAVQWNLSTENAAAEIQSKAPTVFAWAPDDLDAGQETFLEVKCTPQPGGWRQLFAWQWPIHTIRLKGIAGVKFGEHGQRLTPPHGTRVRVASRVLADGPALWDDRVVALLESAAQKGNIARWKLRPAFSGAAMSIDGATYALFNAGTDQGASPDTAAQALQIAQELSAAAPEASIKYIARLDAKPQNAIFRIALDGKKARVGWVKKPGVSVAETVTW